MVKNRLFLICFIVLSVSLIFWVKNHAVLEKNEFSVQEENKNIALSNFEDSGIRVSGAFIQKTENDITFLDFDQGRSITIMPALSETIVRKSFGVSEESAITVDDVGGKDIVGASLEKEARERYILIPYKEKIIFVQGEDSFLDALKTFIDFQ